jgi:hypothetical protein
MIHKVPTRGGVRLFFAKHSCDMRQTRAICAAQLIMHFETLIPAVLDRAFRGEL